MTQHETTAREHVAKTIVFVNRNQPEDIIAINWNARRNRNSGLQSQEELLRYADNAIAAHSEYLWDMADDPDAQDEVASAVTEAFPQFTNEGDRILGGTDFNLMADIAEAAITATLTALIGPREQEADNVK